jgi:hypothetical protein
MQSLTGAWCSKANGRSLNSFRPVEQGTWENRDGTVTEIRSIFVVCAAWLSLGGCMATPHAHQPTAQTEAMQHMLADVLVIRSYVYGSGTLDEADRSATDLLAWSQQMEVLFPPAQASTEYVDMSPARVRVAIDAMPRTAQALLAAVRSGNHPVIGQQLEITEHDGCGACHLSWSH